MSAHSSPCRPRDSFGFILRLCLIGIGFTLLLPAPGDSSILQRLLLLGLIVWVSGTAANSRRRAADAHREGYLAGQSDRAEVRELTIERALIDLTTKKEGTP